VYDHNDIVYVWMDLLNEGVINDRDSVMDRNEAIRYRLGDNVSDADIDEALELYLAGALADLASSY
jgi:hypothetical protein